MIDSRFHTVLQNVRAVTANSAGVSDAQLLRRFVDERDEAAFELLVWRHGPMVLSVCRRLVRNAHDAEDAFQATFLTFARKATSITRAESVGGWLYRVAYRNALRAQTRASRRLDRERPLGEMVEGAGRDGAEDAAWRELRPVIDAEVQRLPEKYRDVFVLCCMEGKTNEEAAVQLGCPKGTVFSRLSRAREKLRQRLSRRGLGLSAEPFFALVSENASTLAVVSPVLINATVQGALLWALNRAARGKVSATAVELAEAAVRDLWLARVKVLAGFAMVPVLAAALSLAVAYASGPPTYGGSAAWFSGGSSAGEPPAGCHPTAPGETRPGTTAPGGAGPAPAPTPR